MSNKNIRLQVNILPIIATYFLAASLNRLPNNNLEKRGIEDVDLSNRVERLENFFEDLNSPLVNHSETFVKVAYKYDLDYRLLPAIACMESSCGKKLIPESYNPFGWGIYGNNAIYFKDYDDAIETVGKGISENYVEKGFKTVEEIAPIYTPPNYVNWLSGVTYFMGKIDGIYE